MSIVRPLIQEQTAIATYLDRETARLDELIAHKTRFIELLKEKRSALITHTVTKGLNPNAPMKDSGVEWLGQVPEHWEVKRLKFVASYQNSNVDKKSYDDQKKVRLCNYTDVYYSEFINNSMDFMEATASDSEIQSFVLDKDNIIITKDSEDPTDIGIPAIVAEPLSNVVCGYHLTIIRTSKENCASFVFRVLQSHPTKAQFYIESPGITRFGLGQDTIGGLAFVLPPLAEQTTITTYLDQETARIDELVKLTEQSISLIKERRSALITSAVTGKIDVREQNSIGAPS
jgi:type I restriction enzyme S subunit